MREAFTIMLYGMGGIFAAILIIMAVTYLLRLMDSKETVSVKEQEH